MMDGENLIEAELTESIIGAFFEVYNTLGFGFLEHVYLAALQHELVSRGHSVAREVVVQIGYKGTNLSTQRLDMVVDGKVIIEAKSTFLLHPASIRQLSNYLRATKLEVGLLLHFGPVAKFHRKISANAFEQRKAITETD